LLSCVEAFDENRNPIAVYLPDNGGGLVYLQQLVSMLLMPDYNNRLMVAFRKTEKTQELVIDKGFYSPLSNVNNSCLGFDKNSAMKMWDPTQKDQFGNIIHERTQKIDMSAKETMVDYFDFSLHNHPRKPTDIIVITDGFCFSACSMFVNNVIRSGSAIVAGSGMPTPSDPDGLFAAGQSPSCVLDPEENYDEFKHSSNYGLRFKLTFLETYNISEKLDEKYPGDFDVLPIDKHLGYYEMNNPNLEVILEKAKEVRTWFKKQCNPKNHHLLKVTKDCTSSDPNALTCGHPCGSDGKWDTKCVISSCKAGYMVDFERNMCVPNPCDYRYDRERPDESEEEDEDSEPSSEPSSEKPSSGESSDHPEEDSSSSSDHQSESSSYKSSSHQSSSSDQSNKDKSSSDKSSSGKSDSDKSSSELSSEKSDSSEQSTSMNFIVISKFTFSSSTICHPFFSLLAMLFFVLLH